MKNIKKTILGTTIAAFTFTSVLAAPAAAFIKINSNPLNNNYQNSMSLDNAARANINYNVNDNYNQGPNGNYNPNYNTNNNSNGYYNTNGNYQEGYNYPNYNNSGGFEQFFIFGFFAAIVAMIVKMITD
ncbi:hypothetical protein GKC56_05105 [Neisseriaceae bacterium PsAf]|nr:hypothetical protein [Neisseriaceae bacterium PsAf]